MINMEKPRRAVILTGLADGVKSYRRTHKTRYDAGKKLCELASYDQQAEPRLEQEEIVMGFGQEFPPQTHRIGTYPKNS